MIYLLLELELNLNDEIEQLDERLDRERLAVDLLKVRNI